MLWSETGRLHRVRLDDGEAIDRDALFLYVGWELRTETARMLGCHCATTMEPSPLRTTSAPDASTGGSTQHLPRDLSAEVQDGRRRLDRPLLLVRHDRRADREELDHVRAPAVRSLVQLHAHDALRLELLGLGLHAL